MKEGERCFYLRVQFEGIEDTYKAGVSVLV